MKTKKTWIVIVAAFLLTAIGITAIIIHQHNIREQTRIEAKRAETVRLAEEARVAKEAQIAEKELLEEEHMAAERAKQAELDAAAAQSTQEQTRIPIESKLSDEKVEQKTFTHIDWRASPRGRA